MKFLAYVCFVLLSTSCSDVSEFRAASQGNAGLLENRVVDDDAGSRALENEFSGDEDTDNARLPTLPPTLERRIEGVGIQFEDQASVGADRDFNDVMVCLEGGFEQNIMGKIVVSVDQSIKVSTSSLAQCHHEVSLQVTHADGSLMPATVIASNDDVTRVLDLKKGDAIEMLIRTNALQSENGCDEAFSPSMYDTRYAKVTHNLCRFKEAQNAPGPVYNE